MAIVKYKGHCNACGYEYEVRKLGTKYKRHCPKCNSDDVEIQTIELDPEEEDAALDPEDEFLEVLKDVGISKSKKSIATVFFRGDVDNIEWLDDVLKIASIPKNKRNIVKMVWFGLPEEYVNDDSDEEDGGGYMGSKKEKDPLNEAMNEQEKTLARQIKVAGAEKMLKDLKGETEDKKNKGRLIKIPAKNADGSLMIGEGGKPIFMEVTSEELKDMQMTQQYMNQYQPQKHDDKDKLYEMQMEVIKALSGKGKNEDSKELRRLQDKIEDMNTIILEEKIQGGYSAIMSEVAKIKAGLGKDGDLDRLEKEINKLKKLGVKFGNEGSDVVEQRKDTVINEGINEVKGLRQDIHKTIEPFVQLAADSAKDQMKQQNPEKKKLVDEKSQVSDEEVEAIIQELDPTSVEAKLLDRKMGIEEPQSEVEPKSTPEPAPSPKAIIFSNKETKIWDGEKETVIENKEGEKDE